jgi:hypothetical protein
MQAAGVALYALSYDWPDVLARFAEGHGTTYPLLGDPGSENLQRLGLVDHKIAEHQAEFGIELRPHHAGVAYPAIFVLDSDGVIRDKHLQRNYRVRQNGRALLELALGRPAEQEGEEAPIPAGQPVRLAVRPDRPYYRPFQINRLHVELTIAPGFHVYGRPIPPGYSPLTIAVAAPAGIELGELDLPLAHGPFRVDGLDEEFSVYDGRVSATLSLLFGLPRESGQVTVTVEVSYQACSASTCLPPAVQRLEVSFPELSPVI